MASHKDKNPAQKSMTARVPSSESSGYQFINVDNQLKYVVAAEPSQTNNISNVSFAFVTPTQNIKPGKSTGSCTTNGTNMTCTVGGQQYPFINCISGNYNPPSGGPSSPATFCTLNVPAEK